MIANIKSIPHVMLRVLGRIMTIENQPGTFVDHKDFEGFLQDILSGAVGVQASDPKEERRDNEMLKIGAALLLFNHHSDNSGLEFVRSLVTRDYVDGGKHWGFALEALLEMDPSDAILDRFSAKIDADIHPASDFVRWLLARRRGTTLPFPSDSYLEVLTHQDFVSIARGLARCGATASDALVDLRDPRIVVRYSVLHPISSSSASHSCYKLMALLGALDRIEWDANGMPSSFARSATP